MQSKLIHKIFELGYIIYIISNYKLQSLEIFAIVNIPHAMFISVLICNFIFLLLSIFLNYVLSRDLRAVKAQCC